MRFTPLIALFLLLFPFLSEAQQPFASVDEQLAYLASLPEEELAKYDIAYLNLVCAQELNGSENLNIPACLAKLDEMAAHIGAKIEAGQYLYERDPASFENSLGQFKAISMVTYAVKDYGVMYNPAKIETPSSLSSDDVFLLIRRMFSSTVCCRESIRWEPVRRCRSTGSRWGVGWVIRCI